MKALMFTCIILFSSILKAQNVGVGTTTPVEKLEIRNVLRSTVKISSASLIDTTELLLSNSNSPSQFTNFSIKHIREDGLFISSLSDFGPFTSPHSLVVKPWGYIGINEANPAARLTITGNETTFNGMDAGLKIQNTASTNAWYIRAGASGTSTPDGGFSIGDNAAYHFVMDNAGNLGLGINPVAAKLHVNGGVKIQSTNILELGVGIAGKETNAGKIGYHAFGQNALVFVGAGTNATNRAFYFYGEGGATFNGPVNIEGTLRLNNNPGTAGQVLTSNGTSDPTWQEASFSNSVRFSVRLTENASKTGDATISGTNYNMSPSNIVIGASSITINQSGLYHFDIGGNGTLSFSSGTSSSPALSILLYFGLPNAIRTVDNKLMTSSSGANLGFGLSETHSVEVYIAAPATISVYHSFNTLGVGGGTSTHNFNGFFNGHLIAE